MLDGWQMAHIAYSEGGEYYHDSCIPEIETRAERLRAVDGNSSSWYVYVEKALQWFNDRELRDVRAESRYSIHEEQAQLAYEHEQWLMELEWDDFVDLVDDIGAALVRAEEWFDAGIPSWEALRREIIENQDMVDDVHVTCVECGLEIS